MERATAAGQDAARLAMLRGKLLKEREKRIRPGLDDKVLADWNGMMIAALANAGALLGEPAWIAMAARAFAFIAATMTRGDRLGHSWRDGRLLFPGLASDFACMIKAALALYEATGERPYLDQALTWQRALDRHYANPDNGGYFLTADDAEGLVVRPAATQDDATPNPNSVAAANLVRLAVLSGDDAWRQKADRLIEGVLGAAGENLIGHAALLNALDLRLRGAEIVVTGSGERADALAGRRAKTPVPRPHRAARTRCRRPARRASGATRSRPRPTAPRSCASASAVPCPSRPASNSAKPSARWRRRFESFKTRIVARPRPIADTDANPGGRPCVLASHCCHAHRSRARSRAGPVRVELNTVENADNRCRMTFVIENKTPRRRQPQARLRAVQRRGRGLPPHGHRHGSGARRQDRGEDLRDRRRLRTARLAAGERSHRLHAGRNVPRRARAVSGEAVRYKYCVCA